MIYGHHGAWRVFDSPVFAGMFNLDKIYSI